MRGRNWILLTAFISGFSIYVNKFFLNSFNAFQFTTLKNIAVALMLLAAMGLTRNLDEIRGMRRKDLSYLILIGITGGSVPFLLFFYALQLTSAASAAFIHKTMFVFASVFAFIFLKEKVNRGQLISGVVLFVGVSLVFNLAGLSFSVFDLIVLGATVLWALESAISKRALDSLSPSVVGFGRMGFGALFMLGFLFVSGNAVITLDGANLLSLAVASAFLFGYVFTWYRGLKHVSVNAATTILILGSVVTTILEMQVSLPVLVGILLVSVAVTLNSSFTKKEVAV